MKRAAWHLVLLGLASFGPAQETSVPSESRPQTRQLCAMAIVAPARFLDQLAPFVAWKKEHGVRATLMALESLREGKGCDDAEKVKRWLYAQWRRNPALRHALLVGDADLFPVRYMVLDRATPQAFDYAFYPSDLYYADLAKPDGSFEDWNGKRDGFHAGYFGEVRGEKNKSDPINFDAVDYRPEIGVGRWPVSTDAELATVIGKTIAWEQALVEQGDRLRRAAFFGVAGWIECRAALDQAASSLPRTFAIEKRYYEDAARKDHTPPPTRDEFVKLVNSGTGFVFHAGHGDELSWAGCFDHRVIESLTNASLPSVMFSIGCTTARFATRPPYEGYVDVDGKEHRGTNQGEVFTTPPPPPALYHQGVYNPPGIGELFVKKDKTGAVAYIGCNTGGQPCAMTLLQGFCAAVGDPNCERLGDAWAKALRTYYERERLAELVPNADWYPPSIFFQGMKYMLFGDPSLPLPGR